MSSFENPPIPEAKEITIEEEAIREEAAFDSNVLKLEKNLKNKEFPSAYSTLPKHLLALGTALGIMGSAEIFTQQVDSSAYSVVQLLGVIAAYKTFKKIVE